MSRYPWSRNPDASWWHNHDGEVLVWTTWAVLKLAAFFVTPDGDPYLYATFHGHADDAFGAGLMLIVVRYCWERVSD